jgi:hypothetical protein
LVEPLDRSTTMDVPGARKEGGHHPSPEFQSSG